MPTPYDVALYNVTVNKVYDEEILDKYSDEDWIKVNNYIDHGRDYLFSYAGFVRSPISIWFRIVAVVKSMRLLNTCICSLL